MDCPGRRTPHRARGAPRLPQQPERTLRLRRLFGHVENPTIRDLRHALAPPTDRGLTVNGRPLVNLSLALNYAFGGLAPRGYHIVNLTIHTLAALALFGLMRRTLLLTSLAPSALPLALATALLWTIHPLQTAAVTYTVQRSEALMALFFLLTLYGFTRSANAPTPLDA